MNCICMPKQVIQLLLLIRYQLSTAGGSNLRPAGHVWSSEHYVAAPTWIKFKTSAARKKSGPSDVPFMDIGRVILHYSMHGQLSASREF